MLFLYSTYAWQNNKKFISQHFIKILNMLCTSWRANNIERFDDVGSCQNVLVVWEGFFFLTCHVASVLGLSIIA